MTTASIPPRRGQFFAFRRLMGVKYHQWFTSCLEAILHYHLKHDLRAFMATGWLWALFSQKSQAFRLLQTYQCGTKNQNVQRTFDFCYFKALSQQAGINQSIFSPPQKVALDQQAGINPPKRKTIKTFLLLNL